MNMSQFEYETKRSKVPLATLVARVVTVSTLAVSIAIMEMNSVSYTINSEKYIFSYSEVNSYKYMLYSNIVGLAYSLLQIPFAVYYLKTGKRLLNHYGLLQFDFYSDKVISFLLAIGVGAAFGATSDFKKSVDYDENYGKKIFGNNGDFSDYYSKLDHFFNMGYMSAVFLLVGFLSATLSSIISSNSLNKKA